MQIVNFNISHADALLAESLNDEKNRPVIQLIEFVKEMCKAELSFTGIINDELIACAGIYEIWDGVGEAWFLGSQKMNQHPIKISRAIKKNLTRIMKEKNFHRIQAHVRIDYKKAIKFAEFVGMKNEGEMQKYTPDKVNVLRYAKVI
tara:strand:+ start:2652 stop:3092 length:441 start_codon:yes stop_codon:yes gene_type:complete